MLELLVFAGILLFMTSSATMGRLDESRPLNDCMASWRKLAPGMTSEDVSALLGVPVEQNGERWQYPHEASVTFDAQGRLQRWAEPSRWEA